MTGIGAAFGFLTILGGASPLDRRALRSFGLVGLVVGAAVAGTYALAAPHWTPFIAAVLAVAVDAVLTGGLHLDGLADTADGLLPPLPRERRLAVMRQPDVGAFGVVTLVIVLLLRVGALAASLPVTMLVGAFVASRCVMVVVMATTRPARPGGLASAFIPGRVETTIAVATFILVVGAGTVFAGPAVLAHVAGLVVVGGGLVAVQRRLGGHTGDVVGALGVVYETVVLLAMA